MNLFMADATRSAYDHQGVLNWQHIVLLAKQTSAKKVNEREFGGV